MLAKVFKKQDVRGWFCSEKLDGTRAFWDGGVTAGVPASEVPWANCYKDDRLLSPPISTGLWSRTGKVIRCPSTWAIKMPPFCVDGELFMGYGMFQTLRSAVATDDWSGIEYRAFGCPNKLFAEPRDVKVRNDYKFNVSTEGFDLELGEAFWGVEREEQRLHFFGKNSVFKIVDHDMIPWAGSDEYISGRLDKVVGAGGEGLMFRTGNWEPKRSRNLLKYKPYLDSEAEIIGFTEGKGKYEGMIGAIQVKWGDKQFKVSGITDHQRAGNDLAIGDTINFRYRELSDDDIPKEARYMRTL